MEPPAVEIGTGSGQRRQPPVLCNDHGVGHAGLTAMEAVGIGVQAGAAVAPRETELVEIHRNGRPKDDDNAGRTPAASRRRPQESYPGAYPIRGPGADNNGSNHGLTENDFNIVAVASAAHATDDDDEGEELLRNNTEPGSQRRTKQDWQRKTCLQLSLEANLVLATVIVFLLAFLFFTQSGSQSHSGTEQLEEAIIFPIAQGGGGATQAQISFLDGLDLPDYTLRALGNPRSSQSKASEWLTSSNTNQTLPEWRLKQRFAMATVYYSTKGDYWVRKQGWLDGEMNECDWEQTARHTIQQCNEIGQITTVELVSNNLQGTLPPEISLLATSLQRVSFQLNMQLTGTIPTQIGLLTKLTSLLVVTDGISGTIPTEVGLLQNLQCVHFGSKVSGSLPTEIGNLVSLRMLALSGMQITGSLPSEIFQVRNLKSILVTDCHKMNNEILLTEATEKLHMLELLHLQGAWSTLGASIPSKIGRLKALNSLVLSDWKLHGKLPTEIGMLTSLYYLDLSVNSISGTLSFPFSSLSNLRKLDVHSNQLEGKLPAALFGHLSKLRQLHINENQFTGFIPTEVGLLTSLQRMELHDTSLSGTLPTELLVLKNLTSLVVTNTFLSGSIPQELCGIITHKSEINCIGGSVGCIRVQVNPNNTSVCHGTKLCGCDCGPCPGET